MVGARGAVYLDASALVKLVVTEAETRPLRAYLADTTRRLSSRIAEVEVHRAVGRVGRPGDLAHVAAILSAIEFIELDARISALAAAVEPAALRSLDAIHVASALAVQEELTALVTYDARLADAARALGLKVAAPG